MVSWASPERRKQIGSEELRKRREGIDQVANDLRFRAVSDLHLEEAGDLDDSDFDWFCIDFGNKEIRRQIELGWELKSKSRNLETYGGETPEWRASNLQYGNIKQNLAMRISLGGGFVEFIARETERLGRRSENNASGGRKQEDIRIRLTSIPEEENGGAESAILTISNLDLQDQGAVQVQSATSNDHEMAESQNEISGNLQSGRRRFRILQGRAEQTNEPLTESKQIALRPELRRLMRVARIAMPCAFYDASASAKTFETAKESDRFRRDFRREYCEGHERVELCPHAWF